MRVIAGVFRPGTAGGHVTVDKKKCCQHVNDDDDDVAVGQSG